MNGPIAATLIKRWVAFAFAALLVTTLTTPASAVSFTMSSAELSVLSVDPGLVLTGSLVQGALPWTFQLNTVGQSVSKDVFWIGTQECCVNLKDDAKSYPASATFTFSSPPGTSSSATGHSFGVLLLDIGIVDWTSPATVDFGANGALSIQLDDVAFSTPGGANDKVTVTLTKAPTVAVPVPDSLLLAALGLAGVLGGRALRQPHAGLSGPGQLVDAKPSVPVPSA